MKSKKLFTLLFAIIIFPNLYGQQDSSSVEVEIVPILKDEINKGFYRSFAEFQLNKPALDVEVGFRKPKSKTIYFVSKNQNSSAIYLLNESNGDAAFSTLASAWGYSDGKSLYLFKWPGLVGPHYIKTGAVGKFTHLYIMHSQFASNMLSVGTGFNAASAGLGAAGSGVSLLIYAAYNPHNIIDMETGEIHKLNRNKMKEILGEFPDILEKFNAFVKNNNFKTEREVYGVYLDAYNKRYKEKLQVKSE